jgi:hypothetical protein
VPGVDHEALHEALLRFVHVTLSQQQHAEVELRVQRAVLHVDALLQIPLRVGSFAHLGENQRDVIERLVVLWLLVKRDFQGVLGPFQVVEGHAHDAEVHVRDGQGRILSRRQLKLLRRAFQVVHSLLLGIPRRPRVDESKRDHKLRPTVALNRPLHQHPRLAHLAVYQVHHSLRVQRLRLVCIPLQYSLDDHLRILQVIRLDRV